MKTLRNFLAIGAIGFIGNPTIPVVDYEPQPQRQQQTESYSFDMFGPTKAGVPLSIRTTVTSGDFDGDGDIDIAVVDGLHNRFIIYENKMPQKTGEQR